MRDLMKAGSAGRIALVLAGALVIGGGSLAVTMGEVLADDSPASALAWWPNAHARAVLAAQTLGEKPGAAQGKNAGALARAALRKAPSEVAAYRTLAVTEAIQGNDAASQAFAERSERLSRRDLQTQLMLIELAVQKNDIMRALKHYDRALRVHNSAQELLFPVLVQASNDAEINRALVQMLKVRPVYWGPLASQIIGSVADMPTLASFLTGLKLDPKVDGERSLLLAGLRRLSASGAYAEARTLYRSAAPGVPEAPLHNGGFDQPGGLPPFDWDFADTPEIQAQIQMRGASDPALFLSARGGRGEAARQLLMLQPGNYRLSALAGDLSGDAESQPAVEIVCGKDVIGSGRPVAGQDETYSIAFDFTVPAGCNGQWLRVTAAGGIDSSTTPWVDSFVLARR